jgi:hypothetical protein
MFLHAPDPLAPFPWHSKNPEIVNYERVLNFADRALGEAKRAGKNRAVGLLPPGDQLVPTVSEMVYPGFITADVRPTDMIHPASRSRHQ